VTCWRRKRMGFSRPWVQCEASTRSSTRWKNTPPLTRRLCRGEGVPANRRCILFADGRLRHGRWSGWRRLPRRRSAWRRTPGGRRKSRFTNLRIDQSTNRIGRLGRFVNSKISEISGSWIANPESTIAACITPLSRKRSKGGAFSTSCIACGGIAFAIRRKQTVAASPMRRSTRSPYQMRDQPRLCRSSVTRQT
jgi:hypothetical protein